MKNSNTSSKYTIMTGEQFKQDHPGCFLLVFRNNHQHGLVTDPGFQFYLGTEVNVYSGIYQQIFLPSNAKVYLNGSMRFTNIITLGPMIE